ncbi:hypothetical protein KUCAC02_037017, partial [Chaenocephalus aceratus]
ACYGILKVPQGNWLCRTCALGVQPKCLLCPKRGGALKPTRSGTKWVHVSCALWIPEVSIGCPEKMEPITKVSHIPASRWALSCSLCREHTGTCIQCCMPSCIVAFHVTCAFDHGLEMRTILAEKRRGTHSTSSSLINGAVAAARPDWTNPVISAELRLDHQHLPNIGSDPEQRSVLYPMFASERAEREQLEREKVSKRKQKLQELEDEFYQLVEPGEVAENLGLPVSQVDFLYQFWKMKRKSNFNRPLMTLKRDEVDNLAQQEQDVLYRRLKLFTHLRQDLERCCQWNELHRAVPNALVSFLHFFPPLLSVAPNPPSSPFNPHHSSNQCATCRSNVWHADWIVSPLSHGKDLAAHLAQQVNSPTPRRLSEQNTK